VTVVSAYLATGGAKCNFESISPSSAVSVSTVSFDRTRVSLQIIAVSAVTLHSAYTLIIKRNIYIFVFGFGESAVRAGGNSQGSFTSDALRCRAVPHVFLRSLAFCKRMLTYAACCGIPWHIDVKKHGRKVSKNVFKKVKTWEN